MISKFETLHTVRASIKNVSQDHANGILKYGLVDGTSVYQALLFFHPPKRDTGSVYGCRRLHRTKAAVMRYRDRMRRKLGTHTV